MASRGYGRDNQSNKRHRGGDEAGDRDGDERRSNYGHDRRDNSNGREGMANVVAQHYNSLPETGAEARKDSRIYHMRSFNNWIKSQLIS